MQSSITPTPPAATATPRRGWRARAEAVGVAVVLAAVAAFYFFTVKTSGELRLEGTTGDYYRLMVDGFRAGHLYLQVEPDPRLKALADPYDPAQNSQVRLPDGSYYKGRYYLYFGVTPALVLTWPYTALTGQPMPGAAAVLVFLLVGVFTASALWLSVRRRHFPDSAWWTAPLGIAVLAFGSHLLALGRRPMMWEVPIAAGFAFMMLALFCAYRCLHGRRPVLAFGLSALFLGLAIGARPTTLLGLGFLGLPLWYLRRQYPDRTWLRAAAVAAVVLGLICAGLAWYNYARFDSPFEFGQRYQLTSLKEGSVPHYNASFIPYNLKVYFAWPVRWTTDWPFIASRPLPPWPPGYFSGEHLYFLAALAPTLWFAPLGLLLWRFGAQIRESATLRLTIGSVLLVFLPMGTFMMFFFYAAERYMADFIPTLTLLALCGVLLVESRFRSKLWRRTVHTAFILSAVVTIVSGTLASFDYHERTMRRTAPEAWQRVANWAEPPVHAVLRWFKPSPPASAEPRK